MEQPFIETTAATFPEDIVVEILLGLPVKSLLRFKCVCSRWRFLISDPGFTKLHLQRLKARDIIASQRILKTRPLESIDYEALDNSISGDDNRAVVNVHELGVDDTGLTPCLVGSCDGLVCLSLRGGFLLYNPTTKERRNLPRPNLIQVGQLFVGLTGFGYDYRSDDYKIIYGNYDDCENCNVATFSLKSGSWRGRKFQKESHLKMSQMSGPGVYWNGALHWWLFDMIGNQIKNVILSFDFSEEKFDQVLRVPEVDGGMDCQGLGVHGDGLFIIYLDDLFGNCLEAWITNDHKEGGSWTKLFSVLTKSIPWCPHLGIVAYTRSRKIVFEIVRERMTLLNPEDDTCKDYPIKGNGSSEFVIYLETLLSPYFGCDPSIT